jgi:hypothetical protein
MDPVLLVRQGLLFAHVILFAIALSEIVREDWRMLRGGGDFAELHGIAQRVSWLLLGLWVTGLGLVWFDTGFELSAIAAKPKLAAKLIVVLVLTANGALLHSLAFPMLHQGIRSQLVAALIAALGAISTVSWFMAAFMGQARIIAPAMTLGGFLELFGVGLVSGITVAILVVAPRLRDRVHIGSIPDQDDAAKWRADTDAERQAVEGEAVEGEQRAA